MTIYRVCIRIFYHKSLGKRAYNARPLPTPRNSHNRGTRFTIRTKIPAPEGGARLAFSLPRGSTHAEASGGHQRMFREPHALAGRFA